MRRVLIVLVMAVCLAGCGSGGSESTSGVSGGVAESMAEAAAGYRQISQEEAKEIMDSEDNIVILDVRRQDEYDAGHIEGAVLVPNETIGAEPPAELPDKGQKILVYCRSGNRSKQAAQKLADMGYTNVYEFGGINTWKYGISG